MQEEEEKKKSKSAAQKVSTGCFTKIEKKKTYILRSKQYGGRNARNAGPAHGRRAGRPFRRKSEQEEVVYGKRMLLLDDSFYNIFNPLFFFSRTRIDDVKCWC